MKLNGVIIIIIIIIITLNYKAENSQGHCQEMQNFRDHQLK